MLDVKDNGDVEAVLQLHISQPEEVASLRTGPKRARFSGNQRQRITCAEYTVGWICALPLELAASIAMLDSIHDAPDIDPADNNAYRFGAIGEHHVVMACLPQYGLADAATVASHMTRSFPSLQVRLMVGIGGGVPLQPTSTASGRPDVRLGDVIVGLKVVQVDLGKIGPGRQFHRIMRSCVPPYNLGTAVQALRAQHEATQSRVPFILSQSRLPPQYHHPGADKDFLFNSTHIHQADEYSCESCNNSELISRPSRNPPTPLAHYGGIASANHVMRDAQTRDSLAAGLDIMCFEMEAAGLMNHFPSLVIRGVSDYSDSHKMKTWQRYAAATASAFAKELILTIRPCLKDTRNASAELSDDDKQCLADLRVTDAHDDKTRIEQTKGGLLRDAYLWVLSHPDFQQWKDDPDERHLLWVKGDPGKGKTMLACGIINELEPTENVIYFFCQATDTRLNSATSILRSLMYQLIILQPELIAHLKPKYQTAGNGLFQDANAWVALCDILSTMMKDDQRPDLIVVIDALDECDHGLSHILDFLSEAFRLPRTRWIVTTRNSPNVEESLSLAPYQVCLPLELSQAAISEAVEFYVGHKVEELARVKKYSPDLENTIKKYLIDNSDNTFLWVSLACANLRRHGGITRKATMQRLHSFPPGLESLYRRMLQQVDDDAEVAPVCRQILATVSLAERPLAIEELHALICEGELDGGSDEVFCNEPEDLSAILSYCGCFVTQRTGSVYFVHQSAKDFLLTNKTIFPSGIANEHGSLASKSLKLLMVTLRRNIYGIPNEDPEAKRVQVPDLDPLMTIRYSCVHWPYHFIAGDRVSGLNAESELTAFIEAKFLYWVEALALLESVPIAIRNLSALLKLLPTASYNALLIADGHRFMRYHKAGIEMNPLQVYCSGLIFSPSESRIAGLFDHERPRWVDKNPTAEKTWPKYQQALESRGGTDDVRHMSFAKDSCHLIVISSAGKIQICDSTTNACLRTLHTAQQDSTLDSAAISPDGRWVALTFRLAEGGFTGRVHIWDTQDARCLTILKALPGRGPTSRRHPFGEDRHLACLSFSPNGTRLAVAATTENQITVWHVTTGQRLTTLTGIAVIMSIAYMSDSRVAAAGWTGSYDIWDTEEGKSLQTLSLLQGGQLVPSPDRECLAILQNGSTSIWDTNKNTIIHRTNHDFRSLAFTEGGKTLAGCTIYEHGVFFWEPATGELAHRLDVGTGAYLVAMAPDFSQMAVALQDGCIRVWESSLLYAMPDPNKEPGEETLVAAIAPGGRTWASGTGSLDGTIQIWDTATNSELRMIQDEGFIVHLLFSPNGKHIASASYQSTRIWDVTTGSLERTLPRATVDYREGRLAWSPDSQRLAFVTHECNGIAIRAASSVTESFFGTLELLLNEHDVPSDWPDILRFCPRGELIASVSRDKTVRLWDSHTGVCLHRLVSSDSRVSHFTTRRLSIAFSADGLQLIMSAASSDLFVSWALNGKDAPIPLSGAISCKDWYEALFRSPYGLDSTEKPTWITFHGRRIIWLPPNLRPSPPRGTAAKFGSTAVQEAATSTSITLTPSTGRPYMIHFRGEPPHM